MIQFCSQIFKNEKPLQGGTRISVTEKTMVKQSKYQQKAKKLWAGMTPRRFYIAPYRRWLLHLFIYNVTTVITVGKQVPIFSILSNPWTSSTLLELSWVLSTQNLLFSNKLTSHCKCALPCRRHQTHNSEYQHNEVTTNHSCSVNSLLWTKISFPEQKAETNANRLLWKKEESWQNKLSKAIVRSSTISA